MIGSEEFLKKFPSDERELWYENNALMGDLKRSLKSLASNYSVKEYVQEINSDGFYPYYTHQKVKILFIAKEALGVGGNDYIEMLLHGIQANDPRGCRDWNENHPNDLYPRVITNNSDPFLSKMLYITYGLNNECCPYEDMPWASDIGQNLFGKAEGINSRNGQTGISYAFMNYSKFDNPSEKSYVADKSRIQAYADISRRSGINWYAKQILLLNPDVIIELNIGQEYAATLGTDPIEWIKNDVDLSIGYLPIEEKKYLLLETWHFSRPGISFEKQYYLPVVEAWRKYGHKNV